MGDSCCGQEALYRVGLTGIPVQNVENACASGSTAVYLARRAVESGEADVALAFGFEQMPAGAPPSSFNDRPMYSKLIEATRRIQGWDDKVPIPFQIFGGAAIELQQKYGVTPEIFAMISVKSRRHAAHNPNAIFRDPADGRGSPCVQTCVRAAYALSVLAAHVRRRRGHPRVRAIQAPRRPLTGRADRWPGTGDRHRIELRIKQHDQGVGLRRLTSCGRIAYERAGLGPEDVDVAELHDCFSPNELVCYEALRLAPEGGAARMVVDQDNTYGGKVVVNPSGGLLSKGHPIGATGVAQIAELVWQLRGAADRRQVPDARVGLQHNIGLGSASAVTILSR